MSIKCEVCNKKKERKKIATLISGSTSGKTIVTYICKKCVRDERKFNRILMRKENQLTLSDIKFELEMMSN